MSERYIVRNIEALGLVCVCRTKPRAPVRRAVQAP